MSLRTPIDRPTEWGPFREYEYIQTEYGEFGVPVGTVMRLEQRQVRDLKRNEVVEVMMPVYEQVEVDDERMAPTPGISRIRGPVDRPYLDNVLPAIPDVVVVDEDREMLVQRIVELEDRLAKSRPKRRAKYTDTMTRPIKESEVHLIEDRGGGVFRLPNGENIRGQMAAYATLVRLIDNGQIAVPDLLITTSTVSQLGPDEQGEPDADEDNGDTGESGDLDDDEDETDEEAEHLFVGEGPPD